MSDIFDYLFFFLTSVLLVVLKITGFIGWDWWVTALPAALGLALHVFSVIASR